MPNPPQPPPLRAAIEALPEGYVRVSFSTPGSHLSRELEHYPLSQMVKVVLALGSYEPGVLEVHRFASLDIGMQYLVQNLIGPTLAAHIEEDYAQIVDIDDTEAESIRLAWVAIGRFLGHT